MACKPKVDFNEPDNLLIAEGLARDGLDNKDIARYFGYSAEAFSRKLNSEAGDQLHQALKRGRAPLEINVENSLYRRAIGDIRITTWEKRYAQAKCDCVYNKSKHRVCPKCKGTGRVLLTDVEIIKETTTEVAPDVGAAALWLKQKKAEIWNKQADRSEVNVNLKGSVPIHEWIKNHIKK